MAVSGTPRPPAGWSSGLRRYFEPAVLTRGEGYVARVRFSSIERELVHAEVKGTALYGVVLRKDGQTLSGFCTCPYCADETSPCKHLWAVVRRLEQEGQHWQSPKPKRFELDSGLLYESERRASSDDDYHDDDPYLDYADDSEVDEEDALEARWPAGAPGREVFGEPHRHVDGGRAPSWYQLLAAVSSSVTADRRLNPARTELSYVVVASELRAARTTIHFVVVDSKLSEADRLVLIAAPERARRLGRDARPVEYWLAREYTGYGSLPLSVEPPYRIFAEVLRELAMTGRLYLGERRTQGPLGAFESSRRPLRADAEDAFELELDLGSARDDAQGALARHRLHAFLTRSEERRPLASAELVTATGLVLFADAVGRLAGSGAAEIATTLRGLEQGVSVADEELGAFVREYYRAPSPPRLTLPGGTPLAEVRLALSPILDLERPEPGPAGLVARVWFEYGDWRAAIGAPGDRVVDWQERKLLLRDLEAERRRAVELVELGFRGPSLRDDLGEADRGAPVTLGAKRLPDAVRGLLDRGWRVEAAGKPYRALPRFQARVKSGIDWFDLELELSFDGKVAALPALLRALHARERAVVLDDGSVGLLPEDWLARWGLLGELAAGKGEALRFKRSELPVLAALVEGIDGCDYDAAFERLTRELEAGGAPAPVEPPASFEGELRPYQRMGLGWLGWLERTGFGGCLADDMGLGKTVQVLAFLLQKRKGKLPSLVVAPRSVLFNWAHEAARFAPGLRVHTHWGPDRRPAEQGFAGCDLVLTTYATLRLDAAALASQRFRFVILDEAQAVKNAESRTAKSVRALVAEHRLALTGTPVENHLGELVSLFDFLNPGMLGRARGLRSAVSKSGSLDLGSAELLARAVRPFILRRTKAEVAPELPERVEQTLYVELSEAERTKYDELRLYYRASVQKKVEVLGLERSAPHVLAALLRLRQAACHLALLDPKHAGAGSAKLETLMEQLAQVLEGGHKALVFSQFTTLLSIVRGELEARGMAYEYLDGKTRDRAARVERFQRDAACGVFLVSLKAGGVGINLTSADYVFILDPWWNPAVEAQAIDRAHRIGQTKRVVAYRLLARDTVEEKVEELQQRKRELARAVLGATADFGGKLTREDLDLLMA
jgi:superfamily II DNA or RNA helicase